MTAPTKDITELRRMGPGPIRTEDGILFAKIINIDIFFDMNPIYFDICWSLETEFT